MSAKQPKSALLTLQDKVARIYYTHGLFCSSHPIPVISLAAIIIILCCYPFVNLPLPANVPQEHVTPLKSYIPPLNDFNSSIHVEDLPLENIFQPRWFHGLPVGYVQQILVYTSVNVDLSFIEAIRTPLAKAFDILEIAQNYQLKLENGSLALDDVCLHISESTVKKVKDHLPSYGCLIVSPANIWKKNVQMFRDDPEIVSSVLSLGQKPADPSSSLSVILFGIPWSEITIKSQNPRNRPKFIYYALTIIMKEYNPSFVLGLEERLHRSFPSFHNQSISSGNITHIYFHGQYGVVEFVPLIVAYIILFLYIYFSVRKIEMVKSKIGMAFSAVVTVVASLCMSVGLCTWFGLSFTIKAGQVYLKDVFPYLVVIIGLENILVLTKSVVSTPVNLDVKVRLAQGLSKEGWSITKNLVTELSILTFGFFTFVPAIQEFCLFAVVGLLSDFFLQIVFFATVLGVDIGRMEISDLQRQLTQQNIRTSVEELNYTYPVFQWPLVSRWHKNEFKSRSASTPPPPEVIKEPYRSKFNSPIKQSLKIPKRLRLVFFWARIRIFQRMFMVGFVVWVAFIVYKAGLVSFFSVDDSTSSSTNTASATSSLTSPSPVENVTEIPISSTLKNAYDTTNTTLLASSDNNFHKNDNSNVLRYNSQELWRFLLRDHWPTLFGYYNISLIGRYISILPTIKLAVQFGSEETVNGNQFQDGFSRAADIAESFYMDDTLANSAHSNWYNSNQAYYPTSPSEFILLTILAIPSVIFLVYVLVVMYQTICSKNYAEWRSSWSHSGSKVAGDMITQMVVEAMPIVLEGHPQEIECLATYGSLVVSSCLGGEIRVWDSTSGECLNIIDCQRRLHQLKGRRRKCECDGGDENNLDHESLLSPNDCKNDWKQQVFSHHLVGYQDRVPTSNRNPMSHSYSSDDLFISNKSIENFKSTKKDLFKLQPNLSSTVVTDFVSSQHPDSRGPERKSSVGDGFDFSRFQVYYDEHSQLMEEEHDVSFNAFNKIPNRSGEQSPSVANSPSQNQSFPRTSKLEEVANDLYNAPASIWCIDCKDNVIVVGCSDGKIEFWNAKTGTLRYLYQRETGQGVTGIKIHNNKIVAVRINGSVDFLEMASKEPLTPEFAPFRSTSSMHRRVDCGLEQQSQTDSVFIGEGELYCSWSHSTKAHQQPITVLEVEGGKAVTGSQDHSLKVFRVEDTLCLSTLHGHYGPITTLFIDKLSPMTVASGSQDGAVCLWDLSTGTCVCRLHGHDGAVTALSYTASYVLSAGTDNRLLVWERFQGHLLNTIYLNQSYCHSIIMLTDSLLLTGQQGSLGVWDITHGDPVRVVRLGHVDDRVLVRHIQHVQHTIVCDYGCQLRVVQFPAIVEKLE